MRTFVIAAPDRVALDLALIVMRSVFQGTAYHCKQILTQPFLRPLGVFL